MSSKTNSSHVIAVLEPTLLHSTVTSDACEWDSVRNLFSSWNTSAEGICLWRLEMEAMACLQREVFLRAMTPVRQQRSRYGERSR
jgi:hypothetical protein